jgi:Domain of unknown function (DUF4214)
MNEEEFVAALYKAAFLREPDPQGLSTHVAALKDGISPDQLIAHFLQSPEFLSKIQKVINPHPLDRAPPMEVELDLSPHSPDEVAILSIRTPVLI